MSRRPVNGKKIAAYIGMPLLFWLIIAAILTGLYFACLHDLVQPISALFFTDASTVSDDATEAGEKVYEIMQTETVSAADVTIPDFGTQYGEIVCERIGLRCPLYFGDSDAVLKKGAGQTLRSLMPGFGQPTMASGHNNREFNLLKNIQVGDVILVLTDYGTYEYTVSATEIIKADDFDEDILLEQQNRLILYTCYPFDTLGLTSKRFFVYAEMTDGPTVVFD